MYVVGMYVFQDYPLCWCLDLLCSYFVNSCCFSVNLNVARFQKHPEKTMS